MLKQLLFILTFCLTASLYAEPALSFLNPYGSLLMDYTRRVEQNGISYMGVDYASWQKDPRHYSAMALLEQADPADLKTQNEKLSFWINAYNLLTIDMVIQRDVQDSLKEAAFFKGNVFKANAWTLAGEKLTLEEITRKKLRPLEDHRFRFALACGAISCPDLMQNPYPADDRLPHMLGNQTRIFLQDSERGLRNDGHGHLNASQVVNWMRKDFKKPFQIVDFLTDYFPNIPEHAHVHYLDFDWTVNAIPGREPLKK